MPTSLRHTLATLTLAVVAVGCATTNTREGRIPGEREDCQAAASRLASNNATAESFKTLGWCDETGPSALASVWRALPSDTVRLRSFLTASANVRDGRIFAAANMAASDTSRRARERAAALLVLVAQVDSTAGVTVIPEIGRAHV